MDLNKMIPKAGSAIVTVTVFLFALFLIINYSMGSLLCVPYSSARVHYDDGRVSQRMRKRPQSRCEYWFDPCGGVLHVYYAGLLYTADHSKQ